MPLMSCDNFNAAFQNSIQFKPTIPLPQILNELESINSFGGLAIPQDGIKHINKKLARQFQAVVNALGGQSGTKDEKMRIK